jgi:hypothetical protein
MVANNNCEPNDSTVDTFSEAWDPLYALTRDGHLKWVYDGFQTRGTDDEWMSGSTIHHHPAGRPTVGEDGTLFVATDGAVVSVSPEGKATGVALYDQNAGEVDGNWGGGWLNNAGVARPPVLDKDGTLYVFDGQEVRAFASGVPAANTPWVAPFGGVTNNGRLRQ